ncbi:uncharacterized protein PFL1_01307 [Pseudozyma flocculosa PF-1]|uniref:Probable Mannose-1-phosphate guanylyltransferase n=1 Tax=Pseudozyma flocculosa TaxID=84751 RepID=A0A5C3EVA9_9BASI|nr:uncharacterized protein PFL1_01307 [Pseudozyma flocculosa PF-1]EPQ31118.1 hypothetical protein PFL1_01307 [Pseudozyma flocculosa PF-1]SPO35982.1 probable Mannose-1-phosphate guanylyltransferase [Pseudozyma flocculosa]
MDPSRTDRLAAPCPSSSLRSTNTTTNSNTNTTKSSSSTSSSSSSLNTIGGPTHVDIPTSNVHQSTSPSTPTAVNVPSAPYVTGRFGSRSAGQPNSYDSALSTSSSSSSSDVADDLASIDISQHNNEKEPLQDEPFTMANLPDGQAAMLQVLNGIASMQKELARLHMRMDALESQNEKIARKNSFFAATPPGSISPSPAFTSFQRLDLPSRSGSPIEGRNADYFAAPHLAMAPAAMAQPAPLLTEEPKLGLWAVVPAGGAGTRLWPLSRESYPKFLLDLTGSGRTLLQSTWDRLLPLAGSSRMMIVTGQAHTKGVSDQLPELLASNILAEPSPKESMAAIGLAAAVLRRRDPEAVLGSFAADHIISGRDGFESAVTEAVETAKAGYLVTIGIAPSHPSTGFGYIKLGESLELERAPNARRVTEFKEKPDARTASAYLSTGEYRWNGGMFVVKAQVLLELLRRSVPELHDGLDRIAAAWDTPSRQTILSEIWPTLPKIAIDHAVAEPAAKLGKVAVVPATFGWDDVGDFASLADLIPAEEGEARVLGDSRLVITESQAGGLIVPAAGRPIACLGVDDVVVVDTPDALLITTRARSQDVKKIVGKTKKTYPQLC